MPLRARHLCRLFSGFGGEGVRLRPHRTGVVVARTSNLYWFDWRFQKKRVWLDEGRASLGNLPPVSVAHDEVSGTHVLFGEGDSARLVSFGRSPDPRIIDVPLEEYLPTDLEWTSVGPPWNASSSPYAHQPWAPLPGPDGRVALAPPGQIICFDAEGKIAWQFKRNGEAAAVVVEGGILVEHDAALFVLDWSGKFRHVWTAPAPITARPLFHDEHWYVASAVGLHRLRA